MGSEGAENLTRISRPRKYRIRDWRYWIPLIAIFTGARQDEISQIELADIQMKEGVDCIYITNEGGRTGKSLRTKMSKRRVPIHSMLLKIGLLNFVNISREAGAVSLFPELRRDSKGHFNEISKLYQKYFAKIKIKTLDPIPTNFHSFRHNFSDELRRENAQDEAFKSLLGHAGKGVTTGYGIKEVLGLPRRKDLVETVTYVGVDFSDLLRTSTNAV